MDMQDMTTAIYVRTAVHNQTGGQSLTMQEQVCRAYVAAQGWHVGEVFTNEDSADPSNKRSAELAQ